MSVRLGDFDAHIRSTFREATLRNVLEKKRDARRVLEADVYMALA
jgi:hypothetical protein